MQPILIVKLGSTISWLAAQKGDFEDWIRDGLGIPGQLVAVVDAQRQPLPEPGDFCGTVLTGAHEMVTDRADWSRRAAEWTLRAIETDVPVLGICFGHQLLADALGGKVDYHPRGQESGTVEIVLHEAGRQDPLFERVPPRFAAQACHAQTVLELPPGAVPLAYNEHEPHHAFSIGRRVWGVQFHPEFDRETMNAYLCESAEELRAEGQDPERLVQSTIDTPEAAGLLAQFGRIVMRQDR
jgi:GMP synthase (glutamine-hydrolysing)